MNADELISAALTVHTSSFSLSIIAAYAVFGDKFVRPTIERADTLCAKLRGELSKELGEALKPFVPSDQPSTVACAPSFMDVDGKPFEHASTRSASSLNSEAFQETVRGFLDSESAEFERYQQASDLRRTIKGHWSTIRTIAGVWPVCGLVGIAIFWALSKQVIPIPPQSWLWVIGAVPLLPLVLFCARLPMLARASNQLERLEA